MKFFDKGPVVEPVPWFPSEVNLDQTMLLFFYDVYSVTTLVVLLTTCFLHLTKLSMCRLFFTKLKWLWKKYSPKQHRRRLSKNPSCLTSSSFSVIQLDAKKHDTHSSFKSTSSPDVSKIQMKATEQLHLSPRTIEKQFLDQLAQTCASCRLCEQSHLCRRIYWQPLKTLSPYTRIYLVLSAVSGIISFLISTMLSFLPHHTEIQLNQQDTILTFVKSLCPEWSVTVHLLSHFIFSSFFAVIVSEHIQKIKTCPQLRNPSSWAIRLCFYSLMANLFLGVGVIECIVYLLHVSATQESLFVSVMWRLISVVLWLFNALQTSLCLFNHRYILRHSSTHMSSLCPQLPWRKEKKKSATLTPLRPSTHEGHPLPAQKNEQCDCCVRYDMVLKRKLDEPSQRYYDAAPWYSQLTFSWMNPMFSLGFSRPLSVLDLPDIPESQTAAKNDEIFKKISISQQMKHKRHPLLRACFKFSSQTLIKTALLKLIYDTLNFSNPFFLEYYMKFVERAVGILYSSSSPSSSSTTFDTTSFGSLILQGFFIVFLMGSINFIETFILQRYFLLLYLKGIQLRAALIGVVYSKALCATGVTPTQSPPKKDTKRTVLSIPSSNPVSFLPCCAFCCTKEEALQVKTPKNQQAYSSLHDSSANKNTPLTSQAHPPSYDGTDDLSSGNVANLVSVDAQRVLDCLPYLHVLWSGVYQICIALVLLWFQMKASMLAGLFVMLCSIPITLAITRRLKRIQERLMHHRDQRVKQITEAFNFIKVVKLYAWETSFEDKISSIRQEELSHLRSYIFFSACQQLLWIAVPVLVSLTTFFTYVKLNDELTATQAFTTISLFRYLTFPLAVLPNTISLALEARIALERIQEFLQRPEIPVLPPPNPVKDITEPSILVKNISLCWPNKTPLHSNLSFSCFPGTITAILGKTAVGKTGLLLSLIGEILPDLASSPPDSCFTVRGRIAYVSQIPWIQNDTVRQNILFNLDYDPDWYYTVLHACCLLYDIHMFPNGDMTEIGENGVNLSGGQKQRVALARAVYQCSNHFKQPQSSADLVILDDCLSAVDANVAQHIFKHCILGILKANKKTVVFATHHTKILAQVDQIILLDKMDSKSSSTQNNSSRSGFILHKGTHQELLKKKIPLYMELLHSLDNEETQEDTPDESKDTKTSTDDLSINATKLRQQQEGANEKTTAAGTLTQEEVVHKGSIALEVYISYFKGIGGVPVVLILVVALLAGSGGDVGGSLWLSYWSDHRETIRGFPTGIGILSLLSLTYIFFFIIYYTTFGLASTLAASKMHIQLIHNLFRAPVSFFDATPLSRIITRVSKDMSTIDQTLHGTLSMYGRQMALVLGTFFAICYATPSFIFFCCPAFFFYWTVQNYYIPTSRQLQRIDSVLKSPIFAHISSTLNGLATIRAFRYQDRFIEETQRRLDQQQKSYLLLVSANRWLATRLEFVGTFVLIFSSSLVLFRAFHNTVSSGQVGIVVTYALSISQSLNWMVRMASESSISIVSVERVNQYLYDIPQEYNIEPTTSYEKENPKLAVWPSEGAIRFVNLSLRYRSDLPFILKSLSFSINSKEKIGVVGRTGAGKSSLLLVLMQIVRPSEGHIFVDDMDITTVPLKLLRSKISIIPQDPVLFRGTMRFNLDPFNVYSDAEILSCLKEAHLQFFIEHQFTGGLDGHVDDNGENLSQGQRQLVCLARALLRRSTILLLDEATSSVDTSTDKQIQNTIRSAFKDRTVITIAHRLVTVMDYDKILVLDQGTIKEFDTPANLLNPAVSPLGLFRELCQRDQAQSS